MSKLHKIAFDKHQRELKQERFWFLISTVIATVVVIGLIIYGG